uniref:hypothetical protein n=1 Tax=Bacillaceae bacterium JMAK1 TaxID=1028381 RepID=UPI0003AC3E4A|nr:hypothetical protein [Bacillaceae bacterium JMAK1]AGQ45468.1 hypothetical protein [Bacillaceae bacterium JMAK1]
MNLLEMIENAIQQTETMPLTESDVETLCDAVVSYEEQCHIHILHLSDAIASYGISKNPQHLHSLLKHLQLNYSQGDFCTIEASDQFLYQSFVDVDIVGKEVQL